MNVKEKQHPRKELIKDWAIAISIGAFPTFIAGSLIWEWFLR